MVQVYMVFLSFDFIGTVCVVQMNEHGFRITVKVQSAVRRIIVFSS